MSTCSNCKHNAEPECRRYPPTVHGFPVVRSDNWCGEYAPKVVAKKAAPKPPEPVVKPAPMPTHEPERIPEFPSSIHLNGQVFDEYSTRGVMMAMLDKMRVKYLRRDSRDTLYEKLVKAKHEQSNLK